MPRLGETTALLARLRREAAGAGSADGAEGLVETVGFGANPGALRMLAYAPEGLAPGAAMVVVLHGCSQHAGAYAEAAGWLDLADRYGFVVLAPEQTGANNPNRCFNWFVPGDVTRGGGEAASIRAMVAHAAREHAVDPARIHVVGLSAGGAMAAAMMASYPELFAAGAVIAGIPYGVAGNLPEAIAAMHGDRQFDAGQLGALVRRAAPAAARPPRVSIWHGDADMTVRPHNAQQAAEQWAVVHGLAPTPTETTALPGLSRAVWRSPDGEAAVELNLVRGLGHGVPLSTQGPEALGGVGPFMLEAGVSSSLEIARFWGLAPPAAAAPAPGPATVDPMQSYVPLEVRAVVERTLRSAGLMD